MLPLVGQRNVLLPPPPGRFSIQYLLAPIGIVDKSFVYVCVCLGRPCVSEQRPCVCERGEDLLLLLLLRKSFSASTAAKYSKQEVLSSCLSTKKNRLQYLYPLVTGSKIPRHD